MTGVAEGVFNCEVLFREIVAMGYPGRMAILKDFAALLRKHFRIQAVRRFETLPGEQIQVDWGYLGTFALDRMLRKV